MRLKAVTTMHRDIKPTNVMVSLEEGGPVTAKIIDLGLAKAINELLIRIAKEQKSISLAKRAEASYSDYRRQKGKR